MPRGAGVLGLLDRGSSFLKLGRDSLIYGLGSLAAAIIGFGLVLFVTHRMSPDEYGTVELFRVANQFVATVIVAGMNMGQSFYYFKTNFLEPKDSISSLNGALIQFRILWGVVVVLIAAPIISVSWSSFGGDGFPAPRQLFWALSWCLAFETSLIPLTHFRLKAQPWSFAFFSVAHTFLASGMAAIGIVVLSDRAEGYLAGFGIASWLILAAMIWVMRRDIIFWPLQSHWWIRLFNFGAPFLYSAPFLFGLQGADRWLILKWLGRDQVGVYAVGAQFASMVGGVVAVFMAAWSPLAMSKLDCDEGPHFFRTVARLYLGGLCFVAVILSLVLPLIVGWSTSSVYWESASVARILIWSPILYGFFYLAIGGVWKRQKTLWVVLLMGAAFLVNIFLNIWCIPVWGVIGAAFASSAAFLFMSISALWLSERLWKINCPFIVFAIQIIFGISASALILLAESRGWPLLFRTFLVIPALLGIAYTTLKSPEKKIGKQVA